MDDYARSINADTIRLERLLPGPRERLWRYLTEPDLRRRWLGAGEFSLSNGGDIELIFNNNGLTPGDAPPPAAFEAFGEEQRLQGHILDCEPTSLLAFTWGTSPEAAHVRFDLADAGDKVRLTITHSRAPERTERVMVSAGWHSHLDVLAAELEGKSPEGFWRSFGNLFPHYDRMI
ncbi:activator of Hsp90 ATPase 1-like family protein [Asticcacaulis biprosthecium C19]|uniref:Activator of Hsp90 ATPase 1-like family protein n=1 Tax=Asticcacaulis biprosthecium C19 TaxID=715226 RepID=F4QRR6_9CAUL|nr:activator of Hsp90 ATPase 1-like family protein [Asticcacaulis biprosthecium C19]